MAERVKKRRGKGAGAPVEVEAPKAVQDRPGEPAARLVQAESLDGLRDTDVQAVVGRLAHVVEGCAAVDPTVLALVAECLETAVRLLRPGTAQERSAACARTVVNLTAAFKGFVRRYPQAVRGGGLRTRRGLQAL